MESKSGWKGKIVDSFDFFGSVRYIIEITKPSEEEETYFIRRRYNNFYNLHKALKSSPEFNNTLIEQQQLQLPPKCYNPLGPSEDFLKTRFLMLQTYLDTLSSSSSSSTCIHVKKFIAQDGGGNPDFSDGATQSQQLPFSPRFPTLPKVGEGKESGFSVLCSDSKFCTEADYERIYHDGERALFDLFLLGQMLEICTNSQSRISAYDSQRHVVENSVLVLRSVAFQLEQIQKELEAKKESTNDNFLIFNREILNVVQKGVEWGKSAEDREIEEIEKRHKGAKIRRIDYYKTAVDAILVGNEAGPSAATEKAGRELSAQIRDEMEARSQAGEVSAVKRLRELWTVLDGLSAQQQQQQQRASVPATPERIAGELRRRAEKLAAKTENVALHQGKTAGEEKEEDDDEDAGSVLREVKTLEGDIVGWRKEFEKKGGFEEVEPNVGKTLEITQHLRMSLELMNRNYNKEDYHHNNNNDIELD